MSAIDKVLWYIENHYREPLSLETLAEIAGVSRFHLSRMFCYAVGHPINRYVRLRRLSKAALALAAGEPDILDLALSLGYGSHEAFSRAFKRQFELTPEAVRARADTNDLKLLEAKRMHSNTTISIKDPELKQRGVLELVGLSRCYEFDQIAGIPDQWQSFAPHIAALPERSRSVTYGAIYNATDDSFDYLSGVELAATLPTPPNLVRLSIPAATYLVFDHPHHVALLAQTCDAIWSDWLPGSHHEPLPQPWFERYGASFDPVTGEGGLELWIPVAS